MKSEIASPVNKKYPTTVRFDEDDIPELSKWKVGGKYTLTLEVEPISMSKGDEYGEMDSKEKPKTRASFKVLSVSVPGSTMKHPSMVASAMKKKMM
jgi:hypothetical protein